MKSILAEYVNPSGHAVTGLVADIVRTSVVDGPGNRFVVFLQGCNFDCVACHNPQTIPGHAPLEGHHPRRLSVPEVLEEIRAVTPFIRGVTVSGGEATQQTPFVRALFDAIKADADLAELTCFVDSNGACERTVWDKLASSMDGAMIDLKCFDPALHKRMTGKSNVQVLSSIIHLQRLGRLHEVRLLIIEGLNDGSDLIARTGAWLATIDPTMRIKVIGFRRHGTRPCDPPLREPSAHKLASIADRLSAIAPFQLQVV